MKRVAELLTEMLEAKVISDYAVFGAVAQMRYTDAVATLDADILVAVGDADSLDVLSPLYAFCRERGYEASGECIQVGEWPVQFIPTFSELTAEIKAAAERYQQWQEIARWAMIVVAFALMVAALAVTRAKLALRFQARNNFERVLSALNVRGIACMTSYRSAER